ncbi:hypothetical protein ANCDUO_04704 [Ancylostoma duodenale]|uniref:Uncharacterized protein n=1 Tax=Ancylostoma duodenale TaxID=51022 RepID=A0A0C2DQJ9_9BILA|nr:hypothetical protein ANCDUO_04704 [Ancylostoma duodenale]
MKTCFLLLGVVACAFAQYETQPSGYGNNNPNDVQYVAKKSPSHKPVDYTRTSDDSPQKQIGPGSKVGNQVGNQFKNQQAGRDLTSKKNEQRNKQKQNANLSGAGFKDAPSYQPNNGRYQPNYGGYQPNYGGSGDQGGTNIFGNKFDLQTLGQVTTQGHGNFQQGGAQTNAGFDQNAVNVGQTNNQNGGGSGSYKPSYDAPSYGGSGGGAIIIPVLPSYGGVGGPGSNVIGNKFDVQTLGQVSNQGQSNLQQGGAQTNVGSNANTVNVGQQNNQGGSGAGYKPSYDAPSYGGSGYAGGPIYVPDFSNFLKNNVYSQNFGQVSNQGQSNYQQGGAQANVGVNANEVNVGQTNNQNAGGKGPSYDAPRYGGYQPNYGGYDKNPSTNVIGNKFNQQNLGQKNQQGQASAQIGGAQTNVGYNQNTVNVGQTNNQNVGGTGGYNKGYDATKYRPAPEPENPYRH